MRELAAPVREASGLAWIGCHPWLYPALESLHIVGIALLLGSLAVLECRVWQRRARAGWSSSHR